MSKLYELTGNYRAVQDLDLDAETLADTLESIAGEIEQKAENILAVIANMDGDIGAVDAEIKRLQSRKKAMTNRKEALKGYLRENMVATGINKITCPLFSITLIKPRPVVVIDDEALLPDGYVQTEVVQKPMKREILDALKLGADVPGAHLGESKAGIRIG